MRKTKFSKKELANFSKLIEKRLKREKKRFKSVSKLIKDQKKFKKSVDLKRDEDNSIIRNDEMLKMMRRKSKAKIQSLESAQERIDNKTYGICRKTGNMISKKRLKAMPDAELSMK